MTQSRKKVDAGRQKLKSVHKIPSDSLALAIWHSDDAQVGGNCSRDLQIVRHEVNWQQKLWQSFFFSQTAGKENLEAAGQENCLTNKTTLITDGKEERCEGATELTQTFIRMLILINSPLHVTPDLLYYVSDSEVVRLDHWGCWHWAPNNVFFCIY